MKISNCHPILTRNTSSPYSKGKKLPLTPVPKIAPGEDLYTAAGVACLGRRRELIRIAGRTWQETSRRGSITSKPSNESIQFLPSRCALYKFPSELFPGPNISRMKVDNQSERWLSKIHRTV